MFKPCKRVFKFILIQVVKTNQNVCFSNCLPLGKRLLLTPGMGMGGETKGPIFVPPPNRIGCNRILVFIYVNYMDLYSFIFIYIMKKLGKSSKTCFWQKKSLVADLFKPRRGWGWGWGETIGDKFTTSLGPV